jgi:LmbE family N-acetylglucosaminyl deacetylase
MEENIKGKEKLTILAALAHPDDESFGMGGTLALYAQRGVAVHLICATRGEVGEVEPEMLKGYQSIGDLRENELRCAAEKLGLAGVHFLGYRDSGMTGSENNQDSRSLAKAPIEEVAGKIVHYIRELRPQVVLTFDPVGGYRHPDHIAIHNATVKAFYSAGDPGAYPEDLSPYLPRKLYYHTMPRKLMRWAVRLLPLFGKDPRHWGQNEDIDLVSVVEEDFPVHAWIDYSPVAALKAEASACHASQGGMGFARGPLSWAFRLAAGKDGFMRAYPEPEPGLRERDLFAGVNGSGG